MKSPQTKIEISIPDQLLVVKKGRRTLRRFPISSSRFGLGSEEGSNRTPLGRFQISEKIGHEAAPGTIFKSRVALGADDPLPETD